MACCARLLHLLALFLRRHALHLLLTLLRTLEDVIQLFTVILDAAGPLHSVSQRTLNQTSATSAPGLDNARALQLRRPDSQGTLGVI